MATSATIGPAIRTNVQGDKVKWRRRLIGVSDAFLALSMMLRWVQLKWKSGMAVASPRSLSRSLSLFPSPFVPAFLPVYIHPSSSSYSSSFLLHWIRPTQLMFAYTHLHIYIYTHIRVRSASRVFARSVYHPSILPPPPPPPLRRPVPSSLLSVPLTSYYIRVSRSENSSVGRSRVGVLNEPEIRSQPRTRER